MISAGTFNITSCTFNCLNICPLVVFAGDACKQQPLETIDRQITPMASILNDCSFTSDNSIKHTLYQQFHIIDVEWARFMDFRWYTQPNQEQLDQFLLSPSNIPSAINSSTSLTTDLYTRLV